MYNNNDWEKRVQYNNIHKWLIIWQNTFAGSGFNPLNGEAQAINEIPNMHIVVRKDVIMT